MESNVAQIPLSHRAWAWFEKNRNQAFAGLAGAVILGMIVWFFTWQHEQKQTRASQALSNVSAAQIAGGGKQTTPDAFLKVASEYPNSQAGARALLMGAGQLFIQGKYAEAQGQFERFMREHRESPLIGQALIGIASCLQAQGKTDQAVAAYKDIIQRHSSDSVVPQAKFSLGDLYEAQKKPELAKDMYEQVERESRFTVLGNESGMRVEELMQKYPSLAPPPPLAANPTQIQLPVVPASNSPAPQQQKK